MQSHFIYAALWIRNKLPPHAISFTLCFFLIHKVNERELERRCTTPHHLVCVTWCIFASPMQDQPLCYKEAHSRLALLTLTPLHHRCIRLCYMVHLCISDARSAPLLQRTGMGVALHAKRYRVVLSNSPREFEKSPYHFFAPLVQVQYTLGHLRCQGVKKPIPLFCTFGALSSQS